MKRLYIGVAAICILGVLFGSLAFAASATTELTDPGSETRGEAMERVRNRLHSVAERIEQFRARLRDMCPGMACGAMERVRERLGLVAERIRQKAEELASGSAERLSGEFRNRITRQTCSELGPCSEFPDDARQFAQRMMRRGR